MQQTSVYKKRHDLYNNEITHVTHIKQSWLCAEMRFGICLSLETEAAVDEKELCGEAISSQPSEEGSEADFHQRTHSKPFPKSP